MKQHNIKKLSLTAMFLALGIVLPMFIGQVPQIGQMMLPMHIPVFLCAFVCGWKYGVPMAMILPLLRSMMFGRPNMYPEAIAIAFEMGTYALVAGLIYGYSKKKNIVTIYGSLLTAMLAGRVVRAVVQLLLVGFIGSKFVLGAFMSGVVVAGIPGIILQLLLIPVVMVAINRMRD